MASYYDRAKIFYFSGTGNARFAANRIATNLNKQGTPCSVHNLADAETFETEGKHYALLGFCFPTHGFCAPPIVLKFMWHFPRGRSDVFLLNTRAGLKMSKMHLPGIGGLALWVPMIILWLKGFRVKGFRPLDMPSNWISLHPGVKSKVATSIRENCVDTLDLFSARVVQGRAVLNGLLWLPIDVLVAPIAFVYYFLGRFALAKSFFANRKCNNCNLCVEECPVGAIVELGGRPFWKFTCESCMHCMNVCPHKAIDTAHGYLIPLWWLVYSFIPYWLMRAMLALGWISSTFYQQYFDLIFYAIMIPVSFVGIFIGYRILHFILGIRWLNIIISYSSLTHYKWWRRYYLKR